MAARRKKPSKSEEGVKVVASNRKAGHRYQLLDRFEAGIELRGSEVKSLREGHASIAEAYARVDGLEVFVCGLTIEPYAMATHEQHDPIRKRRLLLHRSEIRRISNALDRKGLTLVPVRLYFKRGLAKVELALARGKGAPDRREAMKKADADREVARQLHRRRD